MQELLSEAYNEFVQKDNWETGNFSLVLVKGGFILKDKRSGKKIELQPK